MTRYSLEHKAETRQRIIETAGRRFNADGIDGSGIATLVGDAGLTNGAFYKHFESKDDLVATVVGQQIAEQTARLAALPAGRTSVGTFIREYLSPAHRDNVSGGCPSAALLDEIGRCDASVRENFTQGIDQHIAAIARLIDATDPKDAQARAIGLYCMLVGSLQAARAVTDLDLSDRILAASRLHAMAIAATPTHATKGRKQVPR